MRQPQIADRLVVLAWVLFAFACSDRGSDAKALGKPDADETSAISEAGARTHDADANEHRGSGGTGGANGESGTGGAAVDAGTGGATGDGGAPVSDPYPWYPRLDLHRVPFHTMAGGWGPMEPISAPAEPVITDGDFRVTSEAEWNAMRGNGRRLIIPSGTSITESLGTVDDDMEIVIENGARLAAVYINAGSRIRIRGEVFGQHNTGQIGQIVMGSVSDVIIDGLDGRMATSELFVTEANVVQRMSVTNMRVHGAVGYLNTIEDLVVAGSNFKNDGEFWLMRLEGPWRRVVIFETHLEGFANASFRPTGSLAGSAQSGALWFGDSTLVNSTQANPMASGAVLRIHGGPDANRVDSVFVDGVRIHAQNSDGSAEIGARTNYCGYFRVTNTTIVSDAYDPAAVESAAAPDEDWKVSATVVPLLGNDIPPWNDRNASGDPNDVP
jgi:hypothetical protein